MPGAKDAEKERCKKTKEDEKVLFKGVKGKKRTD